MEDKRLNRLLWAVILAAAYALGGGTVAVWPEPRSVCPKCGTVCQQVVEVPSEGMDADAN